MTQTKSMALNFSAAVLPLDVYQPEWTISRQSIYTNSFIVQHDVIPSGKLEFSNPTHHALALQLSHISHQMTRIGKQKYEGSFTTGDFFLHPLNFSGFFSGEISGETDEAIVFIFEPDFLVHTAEQTECLNSNKIELNPIAIGRDPQIEYIARSFLAEMQSDAIGGRLYSETLATQFAIHLLRKYCIFPAQLKQYEKGLSRRQLRAVIDYIDAHLESSISLKDLAQVSGLNSHHYFCHLFKRSTGISPYQYVIQQRVELAKQLLKKENLPLVEIALICGFSSQSALSKTFRQCVGTTPRIYRQEL